jgi:hypothetical protein|tara:strand:- start:206 stop:469 length:264 start_codon:yes stop_codon:yes gene_type:complete
MSNKYCNHIENIPPKKDRAECYDDSTYLCSFTNKPCLGRWEDEVNSQPSHYCPETIYCYNNKDAKDCPAFNVPDELAQKIIEFRKSK